MSSSNALEEELVIKYLQFRSQNKKLSFWVSFHKNLPRQKSFSLNINIIIAFKMQKKNSQSIIFLADTFDITSFLIKVIFSRSSKIFSDSRVSEKLFFLSVEKFLK